MSRNNHRRNRYTPEHVYHDERTSSRNARRIAIGILLLAAIVFVLFLTFGQSDPDATPAEIVKRNKIDTEIAGLNADVKSLTSTNAAGFDPQILDLHVTESAKQSLAQPSWDMQGFMLRHEQQDVSRPIVAPVAKPKLSKNRKFAHHHVDPMAGYPWPADPHRNEWSQFYEDRGMKDPAK